VACISCGQSSAQVRHEEFRYFQTVTSDCRPFPSSEGFLICSNCKIVYRPRTTQWRSDCEEIYSDYEAHRQGQGEEQKVFKLSSRVSRSSILIEQLWKRTFLSNNLALLDFGCGEGHFLEEIEKVSSGCSLYGCDFGSTPPEKFKLSSTKRYFSINSKPSIRFDRISLVHVVEHFFSPCEELTEIRKLLKPGGKLFVQVPYLIKNPLDLVIADHGTFITKETIQSLLRQSGYDVEHISDDWVQKELSIIASVPENSVTRRQISDELNEHEDRSPILENHYHYLASLKNEIVRKRDKGSIIIFGSSIGATWGAAESGLENVEAFFDEDDSRWGFEHLGIRILRPREDAKNVVVPLESATRDRIKRKYNF